MRLQRVTCIAKLRVRSLLAFVNRSINETIVAYHQRTMKTSIRVSFGRLIPLSQVNQYLGLAGQIRNGDGFDFFGRRPPIRHRSVKIAPSDDPHGNHEI